MTYEVHFSDLAAKQFRKLERDLQERIRSTLKRIWTRPEAYISKLVHENGYKLRVGDYRLILEVDEKDHRIYVLKIGHRKNIYDL
jgi:mRNA interferase RelE/StbE